MGKSFVLRSAGLLLAAAVMTAPFAVQASDVTQLVRKREDLMKQTGKAMMAIAKVAKGEAQKGPDTVKAAETVLANSKQIPALFPQGATDPDSRAKPEIWTHWSEFETHAQSLQQQAAKLVQVVQNGDAKAIGMQLQATGKACGACHKQFRKPKE